MAGGGVMDETIREDVQAQVAKLSIQPGDVLVLTLPAPTDAHGDLADKRLAQRLAEATGCLVLLLRPYEGLALLDPAKMAAAGWVRAETPLADLETPVPLGLAAAIKKAWDFAAELRNAEGVYIEQASIGRAPAADADPPVLVEAKCDD